MKQSQFYYLLRRGLFMGGGGIWAKYVNDFKARVIADGGTMESPSCAKSDVKFLVQNPEPVPTPAFTGLLNDYSGAAAAYSLRLLDNTYSGNAIKVRRSSDNTEQDIAFVNNELDTASLETFAGAGDAFVTTWYDQSGSGNDATQNTAASQPIIVLSGVVITENSKPALKTDGVDDRLYTSSVDCAANFQFTLVGATKNNGFGYFSNLAGTDDGVEILNFYNSYRFSIEGNDDTISVTQGSQTLSAFSYDGTNKIYSIDNTENIDPLSTLVSVNAGLEFGQRINTFAAQAVYQEFILWNSSTHISSRSDIKSNINDFYSIY